MVHDGLDLHGAVAWTKSLQKLFDKRRIMSTHATVEKRVSTLTNMNHPCNALKSRKQYIDRQNFRSCDH